MKIGRFAKHIGYSIVGVLVLMGSWSSRAAAHDDHTPLSTSHQETTPDQKNKASALVKVVRESTERFRDVWVAEAEGYALQFGCVSGSDVGAMGLHFVNGSLVGDGELDVTRPEILLYEALPNGKLRLTGADYLVLADELRRGICCVHFAVPREPAGAANEEPVSADGSGEARQESPPAAVDTDLA